MDYTAFRASAGQTFHWHDRFGPTGQSPEEPRLALLEHPLRYAATPFTEAETKTCRTPQCDSGPIDLQDFEIPQSVRFGGRYGSASMIWPAAEELWNDWVPRTAKSRSKARSRARRRSRGPGHSTIYACQANRLADLGSFRRQVMIRSFIADYRSPWWIPYQISCVVFHQSGSGRSRAQVWLQPYPPTSTARCPLRLAPRFL